MLHLGKIQSLAEWQSLRKWHLILPTILILIIVFNPVIPFISFHLNFDTHLEECKHHRNHHEKCSANCILVESIPGNNTSIPLTAISIFNFFPGLFIGDNQVTTPQHTIETLMTNLISAYSITYSAPILAKDSPPPKY